MDRQEFRVIMASDCSSAGVQHVVNGTVVAVGIFPTAIDVEIAIDGLAQARSQIPDPVPPELDPAPRLGVTEDPKWSVLPGIAAGVTVAFRHPGYGWLGFRLAPDQAIALADQMKQHAGIVSGSVSGAARGLGAGQSRAPWGSLQGLRGLFRRKR